MLRRNVNPKTLSGRWVIVDSDGWYWLWCGNTLIRKFTKKWTYGEVVSWRDGYRTCVDQIANR